MKFNIGASLGFVLTSTIFVWVILNFDMTIEPNWPWKAIDLNSIDIPDLSVRLRNNGDKEILLPTKGELWLWPPGDQGWDLEGAYEFKDPENRKIHTQAVSVPAMGEKKFNIHITKTNPIHQDTAALKRIFSSGDWHIQLIFTTAKKSHILSYSHRIPFTQKGMSPVYTFDVF